ncbi:MAG: hypothetical protein ACREX4_18280 [Gammaproteobacteria bacterium]
MLDLATAEVTSEAISSLVDSLGELISQLEDAEYQIQAAKDRTEELIKDAAMLLE